MQEFNNIILFGGKTKNENMPVGFYSSLAMLQIKGKPVVHIQLENLNSYGLDKFIIVASNDNFPLISYINNVLKKQFKIELVLISPKKPILSSMKYALKKADETLPTRIILGDTLISKSINDEKDILFTSKNITTSKNWCLVDNNLEFYDKKDNISLEDKQALVGYYSFSDTKYIKNCSIKARLSLKKEISDALNLYKIKHQLKTKEIDDWYDLGHTSGFVKAKNSIFNARCFNNIKADTTTGKLIKTSTHIQKLEDEAFWYENLPEELKILSPRLISFSKDDKKAVLTQELYGYPSLQELFISNEVNIEDWHYILKKLFDFHKLLEKYTSKNNQTSLYWLYYTKTAERLEELKKQNKYWENLIQKETIVINKKEYTGILKLMDYIKKSSEKLSKKETLTITHGDFCFSNILFDSSNYMFKLIDPRGRLNNEPTIFGDSRYDIAKLRHSAVGLYDFIVNGIFKLKETKEGFEYKILNYKDYSALEEIFDKLVINNGYNPNEIRFIEGLLFLSMIALHKDDFSRQKMFFIRAVELLNKSIEIDK